MLGTKTKIIYLIGRPGTGKYTIAKELAKFGYIICDNQLINNPIFTLLNYNGFSDIHISGWRAIGRIRNIILEFLSLKAVGNYVLTNCLFENKGDHECYSKVQAMSLKRNSLFVPVKLLISQDEHLKRITRKSRRERWKTINPDEVYAKETLIEIKHDNLLELNVSHLSPNEAAKQILIHINNLNL